MKIFIVSGMSGEHDDTKQWTLCAYKDEGKAAARVVELESLVSSLGAKDANILTYADMDNVSKLVREHPQGDPKFKIDTCNPTVFYFYYQTELYN